MGWPGLNKADLLEKIEKFGNAEASTPDQCPKSTYGEFAMLRNGKVGSLSRFGHDEMAANLPHDMPPRFREGLNSFLPEMLASVPMCQ